MYHGDIHLGDTIDIKFVTTSASTGAPTTLSGVPVISAYIDNSTTQLTAGITLTVDFDTVTGLNNVRVVASSGNGYGAATNVQLVITTGTVGGTSAVGYVVASFSIDKRGMNQILGTAVSTPSTAGVLDVNTKNINNVAAATPGASGGILIAGSNAATTFATLTSTGAFSINGVSDVAQTGDSFARIGATGSGLTSLAPSATALSTVQWTNTRAANLDNLDAAVSTRMATFTLPTNFSTLSVDASGRVLLQPTQTGVTIPTVTTVTNQLTAAQIATGVWQDTTAGDFTVASSIGKSLFTSGNAPGAASGLALVGSNMGTVSSVSGSVGSVTGNVGGSVASVTGNVGGNVVGSVASVTNGVTLAANAVDSTAVAASGATKIGNAASAATQGAGNNNYTLTQMLTIIASATAGKVAGESTGAPVFRNLADSADVITGTDNASGDRLTITYSP